jgi:putative ABC transport system substrate-binding protein
LFKEAIPGIKRVGFIIGGTELRGSVEDYQAAARAFNITLIPVTLTGSMPNLDQVFQTVVKEGANALIVNRDAVTASFLKQIAEQAVKRRLPSMNEDSPYVEAGGLMSYATNDAEQFKRAAWYVDRILKGVKPAELPVERPMKFEFVVNLKTAKQIGVTIPPNVLVRADRVIR